jgi:hypothetical protein
VICLPVMRRSSIGLDFRRPDFGYLQTAAICCETFNPTNLPTNRNVNETPAVRNLDRRRLDRGTIGSSVRTTILKCPRRHDTRGWLR